MHSRRMTRLTNAFSKKVENHAHAMAAGVTKRLWEMSDVVDVLEAWEASVQIPQDASDHVS
jgi:hypothetical protein